MSSRVDVNASHTWGSSARFKITGSQRSTSAQLAAISLPEPALCAAYFQCAVVRKSQAFDIVLFTTLNLTEGIGRVSVPRSISFNAQPALMLATTSGAVGSVQAPIEYTIPSLPVHALQVDVAAAGLLGADDEIELEAYFILSPITRIPMKAQPNDFGMALPGEADALDDELRSELEEDVPSVQEVMAVEGAADEAADDEPEVDELERRRAFALHVVRQLQRRLGRRPSKLELNAALMRIAARNQRRRRRGA